jgi:predicted GNAT superfamily acetyltransferase
MPKKEYQKTAFVTEYKKNWKGEHVSKLIEKGVNEARVVPIGWLFEQLTKCLHNDQETMRIAADAEGNIYIETFMDAEDIDGYTGPGGIDPEGWNDDWPKIGLP